MPTTYADVAHLLRRAGFGGTPDDINALTPMDLDAVVATVLDTTPNPPATPPAIVYDATATWWDRYVAMVGFWVDRMASVPRPVVEKMTLFWHGHFCSGLDKVDHHGLLMDQNQLFRSKGMGSFTDLTQAVAIGPAMLIYLDNATSRVGNPNENFARELMELFTLGVGNYTQDDVRASAQAWTGYGLDSTGATFVFHPDRHDSSAKTFFGKTQNWDGPSIITEIVIGSTQRVCARFIAAKLWTFFAYPGPDPTLVDALATAFIAAGMNITELLRAIFTRPEFYSDQARSALVRSPAEFVVAAMRATGLTSASGHPEWFLEGMGQELFNPPNVAGWHGNASWLSTSGMWRRQDYGRFCCWPAEKAGMLAGSGSLSPAAAVQRALDACGIPAVSANTRAALVALVNAERAAQGWAEIPNLITAAIACPEFSLA